MKHTNVAAAIKNAKSKAPKRATTCRVFNFSLKGWGAGGGQVWVKGQLVTHVWTYNGFSGAYDAKWNAEAKQFEYKGWNGNDQPSVSHFMEIVKTAANQ